MTGCGVAGVGTLRRLHPPPAAGAACLYHGVVARPHPRLHGVTHPPPRPSLRYLITTPPPPTPHIRHSLLPLRCLAVSALMACTSLLLECLVLSLMVVVVSRAAVSASSQFDDQFDPFDDSYYESGPPFLGDIVKNVPRVGRRNDFFLKAAKSVPRIGRRSEFEPAGADAREDIFTPRISKNVPRIGRRNDFFLKAAKSVPRIGRRNDFFLKASKSVPRIGRREEHKRNELTTAIGGGEMAAWPWFRNPDLIPRAFKRSEPIIGLYEVDLHKEVEEPRLQAEV